MAALLTFLFTDLENSTSLWEQAPQAMRSALARHDTILRSAVENHNGRIVKTTGDGLHAVFESAGDGVQATLSGQQALVAEKWSEETGPLKVRMGLHSGESQERAGDFYGSNVNAAARIMDMGHGGQVLLSEVTAVMVRSQTPATITFADLGPHKLEGLAEPEVIYQLHHPDLIAEFPPLKSVSVPKHNLPTQLTPLVGREEELSTLLGTIEEPNHSLVSLVAPGGMGKSRLALEAARRIQPSFEDGAWFVPLAAVDDPANVSTAIAKALNINFAGPLDQQQQLIRQVHGRHLLLLLDNYEQLLPEGAEVVSSLLHNLPQLTLLITSRERLGLQAEVTIPLGGLHHEPARLLFEDRAQRAGVDLEPGTAVDTAAAIDGICRLVGGLPLAIELAAAWARLLPPAEILSDLEHSLDLLSGELHDLPARHHSVQAVFDASWARLASEEQKLLAGLSIFAGSFTRDAAQSVCGATLPRLATLLDHSLIQRDKDRFRLHELIRQFATNKGVGAQDTQATLKARHAAYYANFLGRLSGFFKTGGPQLTGWIQAIDVELENIQGAWHWAIKNNEPQWLLPGTLAFYNYLDLRGRVKEGVQMSGALGECAAKMRAESAADSDILRRTQAMALLTQSGLNMRMGRWEEGKEKTEWALTLLNGLDAPDEQVATISLIGALALLTMGQEEGQKAIESILALARREDFLWGQAVSLNFLGLFHLRHSQAEKAKDYLIEAVVLWRGYPGFTWSKARSMMHLGLAHHALGDYQGAQAIQEEALRLAQEVQDHSFIPVSQCNLAFHHYAQGHYSLAESGFRAALDEAQRFSLFNSVGHGILGLGLVAAAEGLVAWAVTLLTFGSTQSGAYSAFLLGEPQSVMVTLRAELSPVDFAAAEARAQEMELSDLAGLWSSDKNQVASTESHT